MQADGFGNLVYVFSLLCSSIQGSPDLPYRLGQFTGLLPQPQRRNTLPFMLPTKVWAVSVTIRRLCEWTDVRRSTAYSRTLNRCPCHMNTCIDHYRKACKINFMNATVKLIGIYKENFVQQLFLGTVSCDQFLLQPTTKIYLI